MDRTSSAAFFYTLLKLVLELCYDATRVSCAVRAPSCLFMCCRSFGRVLSNFLYMPLYHLRRRGGFFSRYMGYSFRAMLPKRPSGFRASYGVEVCCTVPAFSAGAASSLRWIPTTTTTCKADENAHYTAPSTGAYIFRHPDLFDA